MLSLCFPALQGPDWTGLPSGVTPGTHSKAGWREAVSSTWCYEQPELCGQQGLGHPKPEQLPWEGHQGGLQELAPVTAVPRAWGKWALAAAVFGAALRLVALHPPWSRGSSLCLPGHAEEKLLSEELGVRAACQFVLNCSQECQERGCGKPFLTKQVNVYREGTGEKEDVVKTAAKLPLSFRFCYPLFISNEKGKN